MKIYIVESSLEDVKLVYISKYFEIDKMILNNNCKPVHIHEIRFSLLTFWVIETIHISQN